MSGIRWDRGGEKENFYNLFPSHTTFHDDVL